jgi:hypothetical protein
MTGLRSERWFRRGGFAEVTSAKVTSAFESWQVAHHSNLHVKLPNITSHMIIACLSSLCAACASCAACAAYVILSTRPTSLTLGSTVPLSRTHTKRPSWRRQAVNPAAEPPQQNPRKSSLLGLHIYSFSSTSNIILIIAN